MTGLWQIIVSRTDSSVHVNSSPDSVINQWRSDRDNMDNVSGVVSSSFDFKISFERSLLSLIKYVVSSSSSPESRVVVETIR